MLTRALDQTAQLTSFVIFILIGATVFSFTFNAADGHVWIEHLFAELPGGVLGFLIVVNLLVFILGMFIDFFEIAFIVIPLLAPVADKMGIDLVWFGVMLCVNMQTSFMHPPFGFALFYLRGISDTLFKNGALPRRVLSSDIYLGSIPWVVMQLILVAIVIFFPVTVTAFLDKAEAVDMDKATEMLQGIDAGQADRTDPNADTNALFGLPAEAASSPASAASEGAP